MSVRPAGSYTSIIRGAGKMGKKKTDEWKARAEELIRAGGNFKSVNETLLQEHEQSIGSSTFRRFKASIFPEELRKGALDSLKEKREGAKKPLLPTPKAWTKAKQLESDTSVFADVLNEALFYFIPCPEHNLKIEDVKQINLGGGIVGVITYYTNINLNHPVIVLVTRAILMVLKVRQMCYVMQEKYNELKQKAKEQLPGQGSIGSMQ